ncbi:ABC transporter ATP-binding protein [Trinickia sp. LjRoot230]|uniref:ABC transporter ATP-binding protein n=1 Tax=Trinickia sp. LjRoot230 TaxID=3342288 RepID=UPI003ECE66D2
MPLLVASGLCAGYDEAQVLHDVDLRIDAGEIVALAGRNGSGRSTLAKALIGLVSRAGSVRFAGEETLGRPTFAIARLGIGYVAETRDVFPALTVEQNLRLGLKRGLGRRSSSRAIDAMLARFPLLAARRKTRAGVLSGGERQILALARALMGEPRLLIVDEPTEGLAPLAIAQVTQCLRELRDEGRAVLLIEQRLAMARSLVSRVAVMGHGRIVYDGALADLDAQTIDDWLSIGN